MIKYLNVNFRFYLNHNFLTSYFTAFKLNESSLRLHNMSDDPEVL